LQAGFAAGGHSVGEAVLEAHQRRPVDGGGRGDAVAHQLAGMGHRLGGPNQHLLGVAAAQGAGAAVESEVHDGHVAAGHGALLGGGGAAFAGADNQHVHFDGGGH